jgi:hypothetical protein
MYVQNRGLSTWGRGFGWGYVFFSEIFIPA